ncbi:hypothetical protein ACFPRL_28020 [Pseudoclavibacter helvolus]
MARRRKRHLHVRRQLNANTGGYTDLKSEAGRRSLSIPKLMIDRLQQHLDDYVSSDAKAPVLPADRWGSIPLSNTRWGYGLPLCSRTVAPR